jgi:predicted DNA-binding transcriptional regulator AlpA
MKDMTMNEGNNHTRLLSRKEAAEFLGVRQDTLAVWKCNNTYDLPVVKVGRLARYRYSDLLDFIERRTVNRPLTPSEGKRR